MGTLLRSAANSGSSLRSLSNDETKGLSYIKTFLNITANLTAKANLPTTYSLVLFMTSILNGMVLFYGNTFGQKKLDDSSSLFVREVLNPRLKAAVENARPKAHFIRHGLAA